MATMPPIDKLAWVYIKDRKVLFVRTRGKDVFYTPGGKRELGESDEVALRREILEEVSINLEPESILYLHTVEAQAHGKPEGQLVHIKCFTADFNGDLKPAAEIEELGWIGSGDEDKLAIPGRLLVRWLKTKGLID